MNEEYQHIIFDTDYMNALFYQMKAEMPNGYNAYRTIKQQYGLKGSKKKVLQEFEKMMESYTI